MPHRTVTCLGAVFFALSAGAAPPAPRTAGAAPTTDGIYALFEQADYPQTLQAIAAALAVKGDAAAAYDRHELLVLRGETQLRLKNAPAAAAAFDEAAKATKDEVKAAVDRSTAELFRRAKKGTYAPPAKKRAPAAQPLDVADPAARKQAFDAMFEESRPRVAAAAKSAGRSKKLPVMLDAFALVRDLRALEIAATGESTQSAAIATDLGGQARAVMERAVAEMGKTVAAIEQSASAVVTDVARVGGQLVPVGTGPMGLGVDGAAELRRIAGDCARVGRLAGDLRSLYEDGGEEVEALRTLRDDAGAVATQARELLRIRWGDYYQQEGWVAQGAGWSQDAHDTDPPPARGAKRTGTTRIQRPAPRGNPTAGPRGINTGGPR